MRIEVQCGWYWIDIQEMQLVGKPGAEDKRLFCLLGVFVLIHVAGMGRDWVWWSQNNRSLVLKLFIQIIVMKWWNEKAMPRWLLVSDHQLLRNGFETHLATEPAWQHAVIGWGIDHPLTGLAGFCYIRCCTNWNKWVCRMFASSPLSPDSRGLCGDSVSLATTMLLLSETNPLQHCWEINCNNEILLSCDNFYD